MEFLAGLYTLLLVTICLLLAVVLWKLNKPRNGGDYEELKRWMQQQLDAQAKDFAARQAAMVEQNYTAIRSVSETLQTSVQSMSTTLAQGQSGQQQILTQRLQSLEAANTQKLEELRRTLAENMTALQAENAKKLDEIRGTVEEKLQDTLQQRINDSFKTVSAQLEQVYKGLGEMDPKQLASTTMDPKTRILQRVSIEDAVVADRAVRELMGSEVGYRREYIEKHAHDARFLDA